MGGCSARACVRVLARGGGGGGGGGARSSDVASCAFFLRAREPKFSFRQRFVQDPPRPSLTDRPTRSGFSPAPRGSAGDRQRLPSWLQPGVFLPANLKIEAFDGTWTRFPGHLRRGRARHWRHAGSLTRAVPAALVLPRTGSSVDVDILVRQDLTNTHASELFSNQCPNLPGGYECTNGRAEHVEALHFAIGQPTVTSARALGAKCTRDPHTLLSPHPVQPCSVM